MKPLLTNEDKNKLLFKRLSISLLLHLEFRRLEIGINIDHNKSNEIITKYTRTLLRYPRYKKLKKKCDFLLSKNENLNIESFLLRVISYQSPTSDLEECLLLIRTLEIDLRVTVMLSEPISIELTYGGGKGFICVLSRDFHSYFSKSGILVKSISFLVKLPSHKRSKVLTIARQFNRFNIYIDYEDAEFLRFSIS